MENCQVCQKSCRPLRCTKCRKAYYCSIQCQKRDWKAGHRIRCRVEEPSAEMADWALQQLVDMAGQMSPEQAKEHEDKARDEMERKAKEELKEAKRKIKSLNSNDFSKKCSKELPISLEVSPLPQRYLTIVAEDMKHICRFQVTLRKIPGNENVNLMGVQMSISEVSGSASLLELRVEGNVVVFSTIFPRSIADESLQLVNDATLLLTLPYQDDPAAGELGARKTLASIDEINLIQCGSCHQPLLPGKPIERTAELPVGHWDEITDYLICYSGQPVVDFSLSSASADPKVALQDSNILCLNHNDLSETASVLAVPGYGEDEQEKKEDEKTMDGLFDGPATVRGDRPWRDVTGGATVCCSLCKAPLGFASLEAPESFRLLKHRLSTPTLTGGTSFRMSSCASFLAREMVRYAEAKAIFTFVVNLDTPKMSFASTSFAKCILLRLVSWDCNIATSVDAQTKKLDFGRYAKIVFEETYDKRETNIGTWLWGGVDLCCPPSDGATGPVLAKDDDMEPVERRQQVSSTRILLQKDEYEETLQSLRAGQKLFTKEVADATILVKMGNRAKVAIDEGGDGLGLTAIPLYF